MEFTITYFWAIKLTLLGIALFVAYKAYSHQMRNTLWNILLLVVVLIGLFNPIRLKPTTDGISTLQNTIIEQHKVLPAMVTDSTFEDTAKSVKHITREDMK